MSLKEKNNSQQNLAIDSHNVVITANAGSGKTTVLVQKYINLLLSSDNKYTYKNIVAITFTKKAANEMISRVLEKLTALENNSNHTKIKQIKRNISRLRISTIHSFCLDILKQFPIESGIDANFNEMLESDKEIMKEHVFNLSLNHFLNTESLFPKISLLIKSIGLNELKSIVSDAYNSLYIWDKIKEHYSDFSNIELANKNYLFNVYREVYLIFENVKFILENSLNNKTKYNDKINDAINLVNDLIYYKDHSNIEFSDYSNIFSTLNKLEEIKFGNSKYLNFCHRNNNIDISFNKIEAGGQITAFKKFCEHCNNIDSERFKYNLIEKLIEFIDFALEKTNDYKTDRALIDFDDILIKCNKILELDYVVEKIKLDLKYLMIDEFQDTNDLQYSIVSKLIPELNNLNNQSRKTNNTGLFLVGDEKQSIYGFRGADVTTFLKAQKEIFNLNGGKTLPLKISYRSSPEISAFINLIFNKLMIDEKQVKTLSNYYNTEYSEVICGNNSTKSDSIDIIFSDKGEEVKKITECIIELINNGEKPSDIAVLVNKNEQINLLSELLIKNGINVSRSSSTGFYDTYVVIKLIVLLNFLNEPHNDIYCAGLLKSPFFNFDNNDLFNISVMKGDSFFEKFKNFAPNENIEKFSNAKVTIDSLLDVAKIFPVTNLLVKAIDDTEWIDYFKQRNKNINGIMNNFYRFLNICRNIENKGLRTLGDVINEINLYMKYNDKSEDSNESMSDGVNILTLFRSKGLAYNTVIIYSLNEILTTKASYGTEFHKDLGLKLSTIENFELYGNSIKINCLSNLLISYDKKLADKNENLRKLYVAMTRAKKKLVINISKEKSGISSNFLSLIDENYNIEEIQNSIAQTGFFSREIEDSVDLYNATNETISKERVQIPIKYINHFNGFSPKQYSVEDNKQSKPDMNHHIKINEGFQEELIYSASKLQLFKDDSDEFEKKYLLGLPTDDFSTIDDFENFKKEKKNLLPGNIFGNIIHFILENINKYYNSNYELKENTLYNFLNKINLKYSLDKNTLKNINTYILKLLNSKFFIDNKELLLNADKEFNLKMAFGNHFLISTFDILTKNTSNREIWDWKTNQINKVNDVIRLSEKYKSQMKFYAYMLSQYQQQNEYVCKIVFTEAINKNIEPFFIDYTYLNEELSDYELIIAEDIGRIKERFSYYNLSD